MCGSPEPFVKIFWKLVSKFPRIGPAKNAWARNEWLNILDLKILDSDEIFTNRTFKKSAAVRNA